MNVSINDLPLGKNPPALNFPHFPSRQQAFVWRNWELVPVERLARVLRTTRARVEALARGMGLPVPPQVNELWLQRGYTTIIRNNWHLLPYAQLLMLLGWTPARMDYALKEEDFLFHKLGDLKPAVDPVRYAPLTPEQRKQTDKIRRTVNKYFPAIHRKVTPAFDFVRTFRRSVKPVRRAVGGLRPGEFQLDDSWGITFPAGRPHVRAFVERFIHVQAERWGVRLAQKAMGDTARAIRLEICPQKGVLAETHAVRVERDSIRVTAADEPGLFRGLQWLDREMEQRGGPFLRPDDIRRKTRFDLRMIYPYYINYGDPCLDPEFKNIPEGLLSRYADMGVNAIWVQGILYTLFPLRKRPDLSRGYQERLETLRRLAARAADYRIGLYLYINEPRGMPPSFFESYPEWRGIPYGRFISFCTSRPGVKDYLRNGLAWVFRQAPELAGVFTITMSENVTNCHSKGEGYAHACPRCSRRDPADVIAEVNRLIAAGVHSAKREARVIAWTWAWNADWAERAISKLPPDVELMCTSEEDLRYRVGGITNRIRDYTMSQVGPSARSLQRWRLAARRGLKTVAKVQINTTWECPAIPSLPVLNLVDRHLKNLCRTPVTGLMLSWTLGGYPSLNLEWASRYFWQERRSTGRASGLRSFAEQISGRAAAGYIERAWQEFSRAFAHFPFHVGVAYRGPQNPGPANLLFPEATGYWATMVGFPYDDLFHWRNVFTEEAFQEQFRLVSVGWERGLRLLRRAEAHLPAAGRDRFWELKAVAWGAYCHFRSVYLQTAFIRHRQYEGIFDPAERGRWVRYVRRLLAEEIELAKILHGFVCADATIGFEATNQYAYSRQDLREKILNCAWLIEKGDDIG